MRKIIVQELLRAGGVFILSMWILGNLKNTGVLAVSTLSLVATGAGISALVFSVLVVLRRRTGKEFMLKRGRYLVTLALLVGIPVFIWLMLTGEVIQAVLLAIGMLFVGLSFFIFRKKLEEKAGLKW
jgi:LPXTG-motif cell wall-anchored protein